MIEAKRVPYGVSDFLRVIRENQYYVDKTMYIPLLEAQPDNLIFIRPRRFGKSLFLSMLEAYYDCKLKDQFQEIFGGLWIGSQPTPQQGKYQVLTLDFSQVGGNIDNLEERFNSYCNICFDAFINRYAQFYDETTRKAVLAEDVASNKLATIQKYAKEQNYQLYLIIDEYDNFTNTVLNEQGEEVYHAMTHASGFYRDYFKKFKGSFAKIFMMGVSPVTLDDVTSGFNIGWHISTKPEFDKMLGFSTEDVRAMFTRYRDAGQIPADSNIEAMIEEIKPWYDNYCFAEEEYGKTTMYNSVMVLNFLDKYIRNNYDIPKNMVESNVRIDYDKVRMLIRHDKEFTHDASIIQQLVTQGFVTGKLVENFPAERINDPDNFLSLLFYFGMVTIDGDYKGATKFIIPNEVVRDQMYTYLLDTYKENDLTYDSFNKGKLESQLAYDGNYKAYFEFIADSLKRYSSQRDKQKGEAFVHGFTLAMTSQNQFYRPISELDNDGGYADIFLSPLCDIYKDMVDSYIIELKYCKTNTADEQLQVLFKEASAQICRYANSDIVKESVKTTKLHKLVVIYRGAEMVMCEEVTEK